MSKDTARSGRSRRDGSIVVDGARKATGGQRPQPRRHDHGGASSASTRSSPAGWSISACSSRKCRSAAGRSGDRLAARHRRPQRRGAGDRHPDGLAVCRAAQASSMPTRRSRSCRPCCPTSTSSRPTTSSPSDAGFVWLKRELTPKQQSEILPLGIPGIGFRTEKRRFYPGGATASHIVGLRQYRQPGHRRHREIHRRPGPRRPARRRA